MSEVDVHELEQLAATFEKTSWDVVRKASSVVRKTASDVVATAQRFAPVDTGATKNSIHASGPGSGPLGPESLAAEIGPTTEYAPHLEYGTVNMAPHAFMGPALDRHGPDFTAGIAQVAGELA